MAAGILIPAQQFLDDDGNPLSGGKIQTYIAGTTTPKVTYPTFDDAVAGTNANDNPTILDSGGRAPMWLGDGGYKIVKTTSADVPVGDDQDDVYASGFSPICTVIELIEMKGTRTMLPSLHIFKVVSPHQYLSTV